jgi:hypothetical protein
VETRAAKKVQATTVNRELTILKHMLKMAVKWELASTNPAAGVDPFPVQEGRIRFASEDEIPRAGSMQESSHVAVVASACCVGSHHRRTSRGTLGTKAFRNVTLKRRGRGLVPVGKKRREIRHLVKRKIGGAGRIELPI